LTRRLIPCFDATLLKLSSEPTGRLARRGWGRPGSVASSSPVKTRSRPALYRADELRKGTAVSDHDKPETDTEHEKVELNDLDSGGDAVGGSKRIYVGNLPFSASDDEVRIDAAEGTSKMTGISYPTL
jgi:hypothetical protein